MNNLIQSLVNLIRQEENMMIDFLAVLDRQKALLLENNLEEFEHTIAEQERILTIIHELEEKRIEVIVDIAKGLQIEGEVLTLTRLIEMTLGEFDDELKDLKKSLNRLVDRIRKANQVNAHLVHRSLNYIQKSVSWLIDSGDLSVTYSHVGNMNQSTVGAVILNKKM